MSRKSLLWILGILVPIFLVGGGIVVFLAYRLGAQQSSPSDIPTADYSQLVSTAVAQTVSAEITRRADQASPTATNLPANTATPIDTVTPTSTVPTIALPTLTVPTVTPAPLPCNRAQLVRDVSVPDGAPFEPGDNFVKIWRIKNIGSCTWTNHYSLVFVSGNAMGAKQVIPLPENVAPEETIDLSITLKAPATLGSYRGDWILANPDGTRFGVGKNGDSSFWTSIRVLDIENPSLVYDFAANLCRADWKSNAGTLPCPGTGSTTNGFVAISDLPHLENRQENEWTILAKPYTSSKGWISGTYPEFVIQSHQHFIAWVGCLDDSKGCDVIFRLDMKNLKNGNIKNLGVWYEVYDGKVTKIDLDLSSQAGKHVQFILTVEVNGGAPEKANAFWFVPGIVLRVPPTPTPVPPTATMTPTSTDVPSTATAENE